MAGGASVQSSEGFVQLPGSDRRILRDARRTGPADPEELSQVTIVLRRGSRPGTLPSLEELARRPLAGRTHLAREEFSTAFGASVEDLEAVRSFARSRGLTVVSESVPRRSVRISGTVGSLASAFGVVLDRYEYPGGTYRGRVGPIRIPPELGERVMAVLGLDDRPQAKTHFRLRPASVTGAPSVHSSPGGGGVFVPSGGRRVGPVHRLDRAGRGVPDVGPYPVLSGARHARTHGHGDLGRRATNSPTGSPHGPDGEVELDVEVAGSLAPGGRIAVYFGPNTDQGFLDAVSTAVHDTTQRPTVVSISWGGPEETWTAQALSAFESVFEDAAALGVTVLASAGDDGADDCGARHGLERRLPGIEPGGGRVRRHAVGTLA